MVSCSIILQRDDSVFTALHGMPAWVSYEKVRMSVWLVGRPLLPEILGQAGHVGAKSRISVDIRS